MTFIKKDLASLQQKAILKVPSKTTMIITVISQVLAAHQALASAYIASFLKNKLQCRDYLGYFFPTLKIRKLRMRNNLCEVTEESGISYLCLSCHAVFPKTLTFQTVSTQHREAGNAAMCDLCERGGTWWHTQLTPPFTAERTEVHKRKAVHGWQGHPDVGLSQPSAKFKAAVEPVGTTNDCVV